MDIAEECKHFPEQFSPQWQKPWNGSKYHYLEIVTMATYPVKHKETGEQKEVVMSVHDWDQWKIDNPDWERYWSDPSTHLNLVKLVSGKINLIAKNPGWNDVLHKASKAPGSKVKKIYMARRKRASAEQPIGVGLTTKQMKRKKPLSSDYLVDIDPLTDNQKKLFDSYKEGKH
jgi:hypothetical protein